MVVVVGGGMPMVVARGRWVAVGGCGSGHVGLRLCGR